MEVVYYGTVQMSFVVCRTESLLVGAAFSFCSCVCWVMFLRHALALFSISFFCHTSWRRCRKAWNQASSATLGNFIKTECLFCPWILCLAAAAHLCWESCSEKHEFCLPELTTPNSNNFPCWGHSGCGRPELDRINGRERSSVTLNLSVFVCS